MRIYLVVIISLICLTNSFSQQYLVLKKRTKVIAVYKFDDRIRFRLKGENHYYNPRITGLSEKKIQFHDFEMNIDEIEMVYAPKAAGRWLSVLSEIGITAGIMFIGLDQANQALVHGEGINPSQQTLTVTGGLLGAGAFFGLLRKKKFYIDGFKYRLEVTSFTGK